MLRPRLATARGTVRPMVATRAVSTRVVIALLFGISTLVACMAAAAPRADLYFFNGRILAGVDDAPNGPSARWIEALLVHDGRIAAAGQRVPTSLCSIAI